MRIVLIGGNGTIGKTVAAGFKEGHELIIAGRTTGDITVDITNSNTIETMFSNLGKVDAIVGIAGEAKWGKFNELSEEDFYFGLKSKLMGQVNLVRHGLKHLNPHGSITLTSGILADDPVIKTTSAAMVNGAIHSFVKAAALEMEDGKRINVVSAGTVVDAYEKYQAYFPGHLPVSMEKVVAGYQRSILGKDNGSVIRIYN